MVGRWGLNLGFFASPLPPQPVGLFTSPNSAEESRRKIDSAMRANRAMPLALVLLGSCASWIPKGKLYESG